MSTSVHFRRHTDMGKGSRRGPTDDNLRGARRDCVFFYSERNCEFACFSQFYPCKFTDERGIEYCCTEQYMMASKARVMGDTKALNTILACGYDPLAIKQLGRMVSPWDQDLWEQARLAHVSRGNYLKFSQNARLRKLLLSTASLTLVEAAPNDQIWGIGVNVKNALAGARWRGLNLLGQALMCAREAIRDQSEVPAVGEVAPAVNNELDTAAEQVPSAEVAVPVARRGVKSSPREARKDATRPMS